jgi:hypothetical protein
MKSRVFFLLLVLALSLKVPGQEVGPCQVGQNRAELTISRGVIYFPRLTTKSTYTLRKLLELEYGIKDEIYYNGTDIQLDDEAECFFKVMEYEINKKYGKDFLKEQRQLANSLDKKGMGYKDPKENGIKDLIISYVKRKHPLDIVERNYLVNIKISPEKDILDVSVSTGAPNATEISRDQDDYLFIKEAVHNVDKVYEPGQLRGKFVVSTMTFWIEL